MQVILENYSFFFSCANITVACTNLLYTPISWKKKLLLFFLLTLFVFPAGIYLGNLSTFIALGIIFLYLFINRVLSLTNLCCSLVGYIWSICLNNLMLLVLGMFGITVEVLTAAYMFPFCLCYLLLLYISTYYAGNWFRKRIVIPDSAVFKKMFPLLLLYLLICSIIFIVNITWGEAVGYPPEAITFNSVLFLLTFLATGILLFFLIRILQKEQAQSLKLMSYQNLQEYIEKIEQLYRDTRRFQHGYINMLSSLYSYIEESAYPPLQAYFQDRILPTRDSFEQTDQQLGCLSYISLPELKGFLYTKLTYALHQKIQVTIDIHEPISEIHMDLLDLIQVTGIYLDNAIEAALQSDKKSLYLGITQADKKTLLVIKNACKEESADPERFYIYNFSTKGEHRGIGLAESKRIIDNYPNIMHSVQFENHYFYQQLEIFPEEEN